MPTEEEPCRCGWDGEGDHPCHGQMYTCRRPATARYYEPHKFYSLAGAQPKMSVAQTYACDECWEAFTKARQDDRS